MSVNSESLVPKPPAKITTFIINLQKLGLCQMVLKAARQGHVLYLQYYISLSLPKEENANQVSG